MPVVSPRVARAVHRQTRMRGLRGLLLALVCLSGLPATAQLVGVSGGVQVYSEGYSQTGLVDNRRPGGVAGLNAQLTLNIGGQLSIPFSTFLSTEQAGFQQPFNQLGASPTWRWAQLHAGYFSTRLSELTLADARLLGGGVELTPGVFRLSVIRGRSQRAVEADSAAFRDGLFRRTLTAVQLGVGKEEGWHLWLTGLRAADDTTSVQRPGTATPLENVALSMQFGATIVPRVAKLSGEVALAATNGDRTADSLAFGDLDQLASLVEPFFTPTLSTRVDGAATLDLDLTPGRVFALGVQTRYVGPGYTSAGAIQLERDLLDVTVAPRVTLRRVRVATRVGVRQNNVAGTRISTKNRLLLSASVNAQPFDGATLGLDYTNFGLRTERERDTLRVSQVSQTIGITPGYTWQTGTLQQSATLSYRFQDVAQRNLTRGIDEATRNHDVSLTHTLAWPSGLSLATTGTFTKGLARDLDQTVLTLAETVSAALLDRKLRLSGTLSYNRIVLDDAVAGTDGADSGLQARLRGTYRVQGNSRVELQIATRSFAYAVPRRGSDGYTEATARLSYAYQF
ncbi:MAG: hypothetical protein AAFR95_06870 [Bacteroidota bacterium]